VVSVFRCQNTEIKGLRTEVRFDKNDPGFVDYVCKATPRALSLFDIKNIIPYDWLTFLKGVASKFL
jgi:hypothetical protein